MLDCNINNFGFSGSCRDLGETQEVMIIFEGKCQQLRLTRNTCLIDLSETELNRIWDRQIRLEKNKKACRRTIYTKKEVMDLENKLTRREGISFKINRSKIYEIGLREILTN